MDTCTHSQAHMYIHAYAYRYICIESNTHTCIQRTHSCMQTYKTLRKHAHACTRRSMHEHTRARSNTHTYPKTPLCTNRNKHTCTIDMEVPLPIKMLPGERFWRIEVYHVHAPVVRECWEVGNSSLELCWRQISREETRQEESGGEGGERDQSTF